MSAFAASPLSRSAEVDAQQVRDWMRSQRAILVDVREPDERASEFIEGSVAAPLSRFEPSSLPKAEAVVFHCQGGKRSLEAMNRAAASGIGPVYSLKGGLNAWKAAGLPTQKVKGAPISIMRQVQITVGTIVLAFSVLAIAVDPWFVAGAAFMGAGLLFSGATGMCALATMMGMMPWNKALRCAGCSEASNSK